MKMRREVKADRSIDRRPGLRAGVPLSCFLVGAGKRSGIPDQVRGDDKLRRDVCPTPLQLANTPRMIQRFKASEPLRLPAHNHSAPFFALDRVTPGPCRGACPGEVQQ